MRILQIIGFVIIMLGCNLNEDELQILWIGKYSVHSLNTQNESISNHQRRILGFDIDSLTIKNFYFDFLTDEDKISVIGYESAGDMILLNEENSIDTSYFDISPNTLSLYNNQEKSVYEKLPKYNLANKESEFYEQLISSSFNLFDSVRVEFKDNARLIIPNFNFHLGDNQFWMIDKYQDELFLVVDGIFGFVLHIIAISPKDFSGIIYGKENKEIVFKKLPHETKFNVDNLIGKWVEIKGENISPLPPLPEKEKVFFEREQLLISDSEIQRNIFFSIDTMKWETNREHDLIILPELDLPILEKKWRILSLNENELIIERISAVRNINEIKIERKIFEKK